jgi:hypothetical protein
MFYMFAIITHFDTGIIIFVDINIIIIVRTL